MRWKKILFVSEMLINCDALCPVILLAISIQMNLPYLEFMITEFNSLLTDESIAMCCTVFLGTTRLMNSED